MEVFDWKFEDMLQPDFQNQPEFKRMMEITLTHIMHPSYQITVKTDKLNYKTVVAAADKLIQENLK
jgi:hypothetical protein